MYMVNHNVVHQSVESINELHFDTFHLIELIIWFVFVYSQRTSSPWCDKIINTKSIIHCIPHVNAYGICNLIEHSLPLKPEHIHFDSLPNIVPSELSRFGGSDTYADHCPYMAVSTVLYSCTF